MFFWLKTVAHTIIKAKPAIDKVHGIFRNFIHRMLITGYPQRVDYFFSIRVVF